MDFQRAWVLSILHGLCFHLSIFYNTKNVFNPTPGSYSVSVSPTVAHRSSHELTTQTQSPKHEQKQLNWPNSNITHCFSSSAGSCEFLTTRVAWVSLFLGSGYFFFCHKVLLVLISDNEELTHQGANGTAGRNVLARIYNPTNKQFTGSLKYNVTLSPCPSKCLTDVLPSTGFIFSA